MISAILSISVEQKLLLSSSAYLIEKTALSNYHKTYVKKECFVTDYSIEYNKILVKIFLACRLLNAFIFINVIYYLF